MMERTQDTYKNPYQKKIISYLDGSLGADERAEFEAYVSTHPEFEAQVKVKEEELNLLKSLLPAMELSAETSESIENEMKLSVFNLLKGEPKNFLEKMKNSWEEWTNR